MTPIRSCCPTPRRRTEPWVHGSGDGQGAGIDVVRRHVELHFLLPFTDAAENPVVEGVELDAATQFPQEIHTAERGARGPDSDRPAAQCREQKQGVLSGRDRRLLQIDHRVFHLPALEDVDGGTVFPDPEAGRFQDRPMDVEGPAADGAAAGTDAGDPPESGGQGTQKQDGAPELLHQIGGKLFRLQPARVQMEVFSCHSASTPTTRTSRSRFSTSSMRGTRFKTTRERASRTAQISGRAAFLLPWNG